MEYTENLKLRKPLQDEPYDVEYLNQNTDLLDEAHKKHDERIEKLEDMESNFLTASKDIKALQKEILSLENNFLAESKDVYVDAANGNDTTGDGTQKKPWATIQKAVDMCPSVVLKSAKYNVNVSAGTYNEDVKVCGKQVITIIGKSREDTILKSIYINECDSCATIKNLQTTNIIIEKSRAYLYQLKITGGTNIVGVKVKSSRVSIAFTDISNCLYAVRDEVRYDDFSSYIDLSSITGSNNYNCFFVKQGSTILIRDECEITAIYRKICANSGRIINEKQGWELIGSATGANAINVDYSLYTELMIKIKMGSRGALYAAIPVVPANKFDNFSIETDSFVLSACRSSSLHWFAAVKRTSETMQVYEAFDCGVDKLTSNPSYTVMTVYGKR